MSAGKPLHGEQPGSMAERLRTIAQANPSVDIAQFQFIGLEEIQRRYGSNWVDEKNKIKDVAQEFLRRRIDTNDVLIRGADGFLIVFGASKGVETGVTAATLSHGLNEFFLGDEFDAPKPRVDHHTATVPIGDLVKTLGDAEFHEPSGDPVWDVNPTAFEWRFQPAWDVKREMVSQYFAVPISSETGERLPGYQYEALPGRTPRYTAIDEASLQLSEHALRTLFKQGKKALVGASVHVTSLTNAASRLRLLSVMDSFNRELQRFKVIKIGGMPPGFPRIYFDEMMVTMRSRAVNVSISCAWNEPDIHSLANSSAVAVGIALPNSVAGPNSAVSHADLLPRIRMAAATVHAAKKLFYIEGTFGRDLAVRFSALGVDTLASPNVWSMTSAPDSFTSWPADRLMRDPASHGSTTHLV